MKNRRVLSTVACAFLGGLVAWVAVAMRDGPGTRSSGKPTTADCCNVLLVPAPAKASKSISPRHLPSLGRGRVSSPNRGTVEIAPPCRPPRTP